MRTVLKTGKTTGKTFVALLALMAAGSGCHGAEQGARESEGGPRGRRQRRRDPGPGRVPQARQRAEGRPLSGPHVAQGGRGRVLRHRLPHRAEGPDRVRAPLRAHDVPGVAEPREDGVHQARAVQRRDPERLDAVRLHELLRDRSLPHAGDGDLGRGGPDEGPRDQPGQPDQPAGRREIRGAGQRPESPVRRLPVARHAAVREHELVQLAQFLRRPEGPRRRDARRRPEVLQDLLRAQQRGDGRDRRLRSEAGHGLDPEVLRGHPEGRTFLRRPTSPSRGRRRRSARPRRTSSRRGRRWLSRTTCPRATRRSTTRWGSSNRS